MARRGPASGCRRRLRAAGGGGLLATVHCLLPAAAARRHAAPLHTAILRGDSAEQKEFQAKDEVQTARKKKGAALLLTKLRSA